MNGIEQGLGKGSEEFSDDQYMFFLGVLSVHMGQLLADPVLSTWRAELSARKQVDPTEPTEIRHARQLILEGQVYEVNRIKGTTISVEKLFGFPPSDPFSFSQSSNEKLQKFAV